MLQANVYVLVVRNLRWCGTGGEGCMHRRSCVFCDEESKTIHSSEALLVVR